MPAKFRMTVTGLKELDRALGELPKATAKNTLKRTLVKAGEPVKVVARQLAPVEWGDLRESIKVTTKPPKGADVGKTAFAAAMRAGATRGQAGAAARAARRANPGSFASVWIGPGQHPQSHMQEFGTVRHGPQPYMRPAWTTGAKRALVIIRRQLRHEIFKSVQRLRKRQAKKAAG